MNAMYTNWSQCDWFEYESEYQHQVQCRDFTVLWDYDNPSAGNFSYRITKFIPAHLLNKTNNAKAYMYWLSGGPGTAGPQQLALFGIDNMNNLDYIWFLPDHRGAGYSYPLQCNSSITINECFTIKNKYPYITIDNAAKDNHFLINLLIEQGELSNKIKLFLGGTSYGGLWLDRTLLLYPDSSYIAGTIYDGGQNPQYSSINRDRIQGDVATFFLSLCQKDSFCGGKFGTIGIKSKLVDLYNYIDTKCNTTENDCNLCIKLISEVQGYGSINWKAWFWLFIQSPFNHRQHALFPAYIYRILRCNQHDLEVISHAFVMAVKMQQNWFDIVPSSFFTSPGSYLNSYMVLSELFLGPNDTKTINQLNQTNEINKLLDYVNIALITDSLAYQFAMQYNEYEYWKYLYTPNNVTWQQLSNSNHPRLIFSGNLDYSVPFQTVDSIRFIRNQNVWNIVEFELTGHTPMSLIISNISCSFDIFNEFVNAIIDDRNASNIDVSCAHNMPNTFDFEGVTAETIMASEYLFGTTNAWGD